MTASDETLTAGIHRRELVVAGLAREYFVYVPPGERSDTAWPVVLAFHGGGSNAQAMMDFCGLNEKADEAAFIVVYPNGTGRVPQSRTFNGGNCCGYAMRQGVDDVRFVRTLLDDLGDHLPIDPRRIFATGMSNGAVLSYRLADELSDRIAAIAPVGGPMGSETCSPDQPVSVCHFHGTDDAFAPYGGGVGRRSISKANFHSVEHTIQAWVAANGCQAAPRDEQSPVAVRDGTRVTRTLYTGGRDGAEVALYTIEGAGHTWPGRACSFRFLGKTTGNISANDVLWDFFTRHPRR